MVEDEGLYTALLACQALLGVAVAVTSVVVYRSWMDLFVVVLALPLAALCVWSFVAKLLDDVDVIGW